MQAEAIGRPATAAAGRPIAIVVGTRPEAIKLAPVISAARAHPGLDPVVVATGQHPELAAEALAAAGHRPDVVLSLAAARRPDQSTLVAELVPLVAQALERAAAAAAVVQGDTASAFAGALAAFAREVPVVHVEAGLRSWDLANPFPEEGYRRMISAITSLHLAPTPAAQVNLEREGVPVNRICCTGNTVVDAVQRTWSLHPDPERPDLERFRAKPQRRLVLATVHRRESWGAPLRRVLAGIGALLDQRPDLEVIVPVHPNPRVASAVEAVLGDRPRAHLTVPLSHRDLLWLLAQVDVVVSDSGGIQEEAPSFGVHVVVLRDATERLEAVEAGCATLVGTDPDRVVAATLAALDVGRVPDGAARADGPNPFGDGRAAQRVVDAIDLHLDGRRLPTGWSGASHRRTDLVRATGGRSGATR